MHSKVRTSIKVKLNTKAAEISCEEGSSAAGKSEDADKHSDASLPTVIGSMEEYAKIVGKSVEAIEDERVDPDLAGGDSSDEAGDEEEEEDDGLWGAIMGGASK